MLSSKLLAHDTSGDKSCLFVTITFFVYPVCFLCLYNSGEQNGNHPLLFFLPDQTAHYYQVSFQIPSIDYSPDFSVEHSKARTDLKQKVNNEVSMSFANIVTTGNFIEGTEHGRVQKALLREAVY